MRARLPLPFKKNSLLIKLLAAFCAVILLLVSFNLIAYKFFSNRMQQEIIRYNNQNLRNTVERYENHLQIIQGAVTRLFFNQKVLLLNELGNAEQFDPVNLVAEEIRDILRNDQLYLNNVVILFDKNGFVVEKNGPSELNQMFSSYYVSSDYTPAFWRDQLQHTYRSKVFPQAAFELPQANSSGNFIPIVFKNKVNPDFYIAVLLDAKQIFKAFHNSVNNRFYISDASGSVLFNSDKTIIEPDLLAQLKGGTNLLQLNDNYYFYYKSEASGLTYINVIPNTKIAEGITKLNLVLISLLLGAILISIGVSVVVSFKFNSPIQKIISSIRHTTPNGFLHSKIEEYNVLHDMINQMVKTNRDIKHDLNQKNSELKHLGYMNKLKDIYTSSNGLVGTNKPFYFVLFHLTMTPQFSDLTSAEQAKAVYFLKEFIHISLEDMFGDTVTLQVEKNQVLSLLFMEEENDTLIQNLQRFKLLFDSDKAHCYWTIAVQPELYGFDEFGEVYKRTNEMVRQRELNGETQIITQWKPQNEFIWFLPSQEQEFVANLQAGQGESVIALVTKVLLRMQKKEAWSGQYLDFACEVVDKTVRTLAVLNLDIRPLCGDNSPRRTMEGFTDVEQYIRFFEHFLTDVVQDINQKREDRDWIVDFLQDYVQHHYSEDLSLDLVADKLNLSSGYVSKYYKEKTGVNFSDFLNEFRIQKAKELLQQSDYRIQDIAGQVGYFNVNSFIRMFRKVTGMPPGEYRRMHTLPDSEPYGPSIQQDA
jgi:YesN/AraC family two-component response regulator